MFSTHRKFDTKTKNLGKFIRNLNSLDAQKEGPKFPSQDVLLYLNQLSVGIYTLVLARTGRFIYHL